MNFLKRAGAILMVVAIFASSCNKYADDFKQLNTKLDAVASSVAGLTQLATDVAATKASVTALQSAVAALPTSASVTALSTSLTAVSGKVDAIGTSLAAVAATGTANATAIAAVKADLAALVTSQAAANAAATAGFAADVAKMTALDTKVSAVVASLTAIAAQETALGTAVAGNTTAIAANAASLTALAAQASALATSVAALTTANAAGFAAAVTANAALATQAATIIADLTANTSADAVTALVIAGLKTDLAAAKVVIDQINNNTIKTVTVVTITGTAQQGVVLTAAADAGATVTYQWYSATTSGGTYTAIATATAATYTPVLGDVGLFLKVKVIGTGSWAGTGATISSSATAAVAALIPITGIAATTGLGGVGAKLTAGALTPAAATVTYQWVSSATQFGTYLPIAGATSATYTPVTADATTWIAVVATGTGGYYNTVTATAVGPVAFVDKTSAPFTLVSANNVVTITLTGGTFVTTPTAGQFTFLGTDAVALASGTFAKVSSTVVTFTKVGGFLGTSSNTVTIANAAFATQATSVAAVASTEVLLTPVSLPIAGMVAPVAGVAPVTAVTGTGFTGTVAWSGAPALFLPGTIYTATITLTAATNYTFAGIASNSYTSVAGGVLTNSANSGTVAIVYAATGIQTVNIPAIAGVTAPVTGATAVTVSTPNTQLTGVVTWAPALVAGKFQSGVVYTATISLVPNSGYSVTALGANYFTVAGATATNSAGLGTVTAVFPITL